MNKNGNIIIIMIVILALIAGVLWFLSFENSKNMNANAQNKKYPAPQQQQLNNPENSPNNY